jgi:signal transduction histidine kinase
VRPQWATRQLLALVALAVVLVTISGSLELLSAVQLALDRAGIEAVLISGSIRRELAQLAPEYPPGSLEGIGEDPRLQAVLMDAFGLAPSVLSVAVLDPDGVAVAHTQPDRIGSLLVPNPPLPEKAGWREAARMLFQIARGPALYQTETTLLVGERPYATIRVTFAGTFLWDAAKRAARRGSVAAVIVVAFALLVGILLSRVTAGRLRTLEAGVVALREGRFREPLPETGIDEFSRLARELNLLGRRFESEASRGAGGSLPDDSTAARAVDQSRVLAHLGQTAAGVAHELGNQLQVVQSDLEALRRAEELEPDEIRLHVESAVGGVGNLGGAVRGFLRLARIQPLSIQNLDLNRLMEEVHAELQPEAELAGISLELDLASGVMETHADRDVLRQAIHNLVRNALRALSGREGGIVLGTARDAGSAVLSVVDDGPGIPPEVLKKVFDLYFTTRADGSGVGLAVVRQSMELHGGDVEIDSGPDRGTVVRLRLPLRPR